jgi:hypothetical protein
VTTIYSFVHFSQLQNLVFFYSVPEHQVETVAPDLVTEFFDAPKTMQCAENEVLKGIVSRDWGRLQMVLLDRSEVRAIPLNIYFEFKIIFSIKFFLKCVRPGGL